MMSLTKNRWIGIVALTAFFGTFSANALDRPEGVPADAVLYTENYHANGAKNEEGYLIEGEPIGKWQRWHANGKLEAEAFFDEDGPTGTWTYWDESGKKELEEIYEKGELIKMTRFTE